jgi:hypothetical protein
MSAQMTYIGNVRQLVEILHQPNTEARYLPLECHGIAEGLALPELAPHLETEQPYHQALTLTNLYEFVQVPGAIVMNTGCLLGAPAFAQAFLRGGARTYIGAESDPLGDAALLYVLRLFYGLHCQQASLLEAHEQARHQVPETAIFRLWEA